MNSEPDRRTDQIGPELLAELESQAEVLGVYDEGQDIALDLHEDLFAPETRQRALAFLQSPRYESAVQTYRRISTGSIPLPDGQ